jgi:uncharacterized membrane protein YeaQ/YmgE (transglycosylase-associated protein family)
VAERQDIEDLVANSDSHSVTSLTGFIVALVGAVVLLFIVNLITKRR